MTWLGTRSDRWARESFPEGTLNDKQLRTLLQIDDKGRRIVDLSHTAHPAIFKLTDEIVEVWTEFGRNWPNHQRLVVFLHSDGRFVAAIEEKYKGPSGVHPPGAKFRKWAVAFLRRPDMDRYAQPEEVEYENMHGLSNNGAIDQVRKFIHENWMEEVTV
jgi:hypothetical protein